MVVRHISISLFLFFLSYYANGQKMYSMLGGTTGMKGIALSFSYEKPFKTQIDSLNEIIIKSPLNLSSSLNYEYKNLIGNDFNSLQLSAGAIFKVIDHEKNNEQGNRKMDINTGLKGYAQYFNDNVIFIGRNEKNISFGIKPLLSLEYLYTNRTNFLIKYEQDIVLINKEFGNNYYLLIGFKIKI